MNQIAFSTVSGILEVFKPDHNLLPVLEEFTLQQRDKTYQGKHEDLTGVSETPEREQAQLIGEEREN